MPEINGSIIPDYVRVVMPDTPYLRVVMPANIAVDDGDEPGAYFAPRFFGTRFFAERYFG